MRSSVKSFTVGTRRVGLDRAGRSKRIETEGDIYPPVN